MKQKGSVSAQRRQRGKVIETEKSGRQSLDGEL